MRGCAVSSSPPRTTPRYALAFDDAPIFSSYNEPLPAQIVAAGWPLRKSSDTAPLPMPLLLLLLMLRAACCVLLLLLLLQAADLFTSLDPAAPGGLCDLRPGCGSPRLLRLDDPAAPDGDYAVSKLMGEELCRLAAMRDGLEVVCLRIGWFKGGALFLKLPMIILPLRSPSHLLPPIHTAAVLCPACAAAPAIWSASPRGCRALGVPR